jgi:hypothetical protein
MRQFMKHLFKCTLVMVCFLHLLNISAVAGEKEERIRLLQEKMKALQAQLEIVQETKLREQPPTETPWQPIQNPGDERPAYAQYVYLLGSQVAKADLDSALQQMYYLASQDKMEQKGALFVVPALPLAPGELMNVDTYNRELAVQLLAKVGVPSAVEGGILVAAKPLTRLNADDRELLFIDLAGCDQILRARIFELLLSQRMFSPDGTIHSYLWELIKSASPQVFNLYWQGDLAWLSVDN